MGDRVISYKEIREIPLTLGAKSAVESRFGLSTTLSAEAWENANDLLALMGTSSFTVDTAALDTTSGLDAPNLGDAPNVTRPDAYESGIAAISFPDLTALREQLGLTTIELNSIDLPPLQAIAPSITLPDAPTDAIPDVPDGAPSVSDPDMPVAPSFTLPDAPTLNDLVIPAAPELSVASFEGTMPTMDLTPPEPMFVYNEATYESNVADAVRTKLYHDLVNGGTGLAEDVEAAIWSNYQAREAVKFEAQRTEVANRWAGSNFEFPPGALDDALTELEQNISREMNLASRDIAIKQAELAQQNTQFAITSGLVHEQQLMGYANQIAQRAFDKAKAAVEMAVTIYQAKVTAYTAQLEGYKTQAQVYEAKIRAELAKVELYRGQLEGIKVAADIQAQRVAIYSARIQALHTLIALYTAQLEGSKFKIDVDRVRLQAFAEQINAAKARIEGVTAKYNLYQARLAGETTKVDIYGKQVAAHKTEVEAKRIEADIDLAQVQAAIQANSEKVEILKAAIQKYSAEINAQTEEERTRATAYGAQTEMYKVDVGAKDAHVAQLVERYKAQVGEWQAEIDAAVKEAEVNLRTQTAMKEIQTRSIEAAANISAQMVASALSSVSASAQMGYSESLQNSYAGRESDSASRSYRCTENVSD